MELKKIRNCLDFWGGITHTKNIQREKYLALFLMVLKLW